MMDKIDIDRFKFGMQGAFGELSESQSKGLEFLLGSIINDTNDIPLRWAAYMLATAYHETGHTFQPIEEYGHGAGHPYDIPDAKTGKTYYGRGYVQLTWRDNYEAMGRVFGIDLLHEPELALHSDVAYKIMSYGMRKGSFTGASLQRFINGDVCDYVHARKIINGMDCADKIARYAVDIEKALSDSVVL